MRPPVTAPRRVRLDRSGVESAAAYSVVYPLKVSRNGRYLVDQRNVPFMIVGDSPQAMIGDLSLEEADASTSPIAKLRASTPSGWICCASNYTGCQEGGTTFDGIEPFTTPGDLSTPNPAYFERVDAMIRLAARAGIVLFLDPIETGGWLGVLRHNGVAKARAYGRFLGSEVQELPQHRLVERQRLPHLEKSGGRRPRTRSCEGHSIGRPRAHPDVELDPRPSSPATIHGGGRCIGLDAAYTYFATYGEVLRAYNRKPPMPVYLAEASYEFEKKSVIARGTPLNLRRQAYWSMLSGAAGQFYGNGYTWPFLDGWKDHLDTPGSAQIGYLVKLFAPMRWFQLVPDQTHKVVTAGYGTFDLNKNVASSNYVTTASTPDGGSPSRICRPEAR